MRRCAYQNFEGVGDARVVRPLREARLQRLQEVAVHLVQLGNAEEDDVDVFSWNDLVQRLVGHTEQRLHVLDTKIQDSKAASFMRKEMETCT